MPRSETIASKVNLAKNFLGQRGTGFMQTLSARDAEFGFGRLIDLTSARSAAEAKRERPVVAAMAVEEHELLKALELPKTLTAPENQA